jgi:hypothetical protein
MGGGWRGHRFFLLAIIHPPVNLIHDYRDAVDLLQFGVGDRFFLFRLAQLLQMDILFDTADHDQSLASS